jgi:N-acetylglucosaminyl-diphospho-decaprenol L-rhamnosyltransferase
VLRADSLSVPVHYMEQPEQAGVGIVGIQLLDCTGKVSRSCARFPTFGRMVAASLGLDHLSPSVFPSHQMKEWNHLDTREVNQVIGAFMLVRRSVFERLGGFDERFFVYMEDLDLVLRMHRLGYSCVYLTSASAFHEGGATFRRVRSESLFFRLRSGIQYAFKHFGSLRGFAVLIFTIALEPIPRLAFAVWRKSWSDVTATIGAYVRIWKEVLSLSLLKAGRRSGSFAGTHDQQRSSFASPNRP